MVAKRFVYVNHVGIIETTATIGDQVVAGQPIGRIGEQLLIAPLSGSIRGLVRPGVLVAAGTKVLEVDPRGAAVQVSGLGERPHHIAAGVLAAIRQWQAAGAEHLPD